MRLLRFFALITIVSFASCSKQYIVPIVESGAKPKNIILIIGDGMGLSHITAHRIEKEETVFDRFPEVGLVATHCINNVITDSSAGATAMATGYKTLELSVGIDQYGRPQKSIMDMAQEMNMATGIVTTSSVLDATPASFYAHSGNRYWLDTISRDLLHSKVDFVIGGGKQYFDGTIEGSPYSIEDFENKGFSVSDFFQKPVNQINTSARERILFFTGTEVALIKTLGEKHLAECSEKAISYLTRREKPGFFLLVEGAQIDWASHARMGDELLIRMEVIENAIQSVLDWAIRDGETLVIVTADHTTGGLTIVKGADPKKLYLNFSTNDHTGSMVPLFAYGPGAESFNGIMDNTDIFHKLAKLLDLPSISTLEVSGSK